MAVPLPTLESARVPRLRAREICSPQAQRLLGTRARAVRRGPVADWLPEWGKVNLGNQEIHRILAGPVLIPGVESNPAERLDAEVEPPTGRLGRSVHRVARGALHGPQ